MAVLASTTLAGMSTAAGDVIIQGTIDGEENAWERLKAQGDSPEFFTDISSNIQLFNLHGVKDASRFDPKGSILFSMSRMGDRVVDVELGYYEDSRAGPDFLANDHVGEIDYTIDSVAIDGDTARVSGSATGELHFVEDRMANEYDASTTRSVTIEFDTTLPRQ